MTQHVYYHERVREELLPTFTMLEEEPKLPNIHSASILTPSASHQTHGIILLQDAARSNNLNEKREKGRNQKLPPLPDLRSGRIRILELVHRSWNGTYRCRMGEKGSRTVEKAGEGRIFIPATRGALDHSWRSEPVLTGGQRTNQENGRMLIFLMTPIWAFGEALFFLKGTWSVRSGDLQGSVGFVGYGV
jgi:hypothetical protein